MRGSITVQLVQLAGAIAQDESARVEVLLTEISQLENRLAELRANCDLAKNAVGRVDQFAPEIGGNYQCPMCWVSNGLHGDLRLIPSDTKDGLFRCENCNRTIEISG